jgi:class 3 adenylate cyclase
MMFCDLVGSTALAARLDPEDLREVIGAYQKCVAEAVARFRGFVAKYMGDGVLGYFGIRKRTKTMPSGRCRAGWVRSRLSVGSLSNPASFRRASGSLRG